jgi:hypothetical protein
MNRVKDYIRFAVCFAGLGYIVLWPLTAHDGSIAAFEASLICGGRFFAGTICRLPQPMTLPPGLHLIGLLSAVAVVARYVWRRFSGVRRLRRVRPGDVAAAVWRLRMVTRARSLTAMPRRCAVKPRRQFGLRGIPH